MTDKPREDLEDETNEPAEHSADPKVEDLDVREEQGNNVKGGAPVKGGGEFLKVTFS